MAVILHRRVEGVEAAASGLVDHCVKAGQAYSTALQLARDIAKVGRCTCCVVSCTVTMFHL